MIGQRAREAGLQSAIDAVGGVSALARGLGISQPAVSIWERVPAERVLSVEALTGVPRTLLRPDLYPEGAAPIEQPTEVDEIDLVRAHEYGLLALLLGRAPDAATLGRLAGLKGDVSPLGLAHVELAEAAAADPAAVSREYFDLFVGLGRGELVPYASYYLTGFLHERPLARVREDLGRLGLARADTLHEPEDHIAFLCEVMAALCDGRHGTARGEDQVFFERHVKPWAARFFADLETAPSARFYRHVAVIGRLFMEIEAEAFEMER